MSWLTNLTDAGNASKSLTGMLKNLEAKLDAVLDIPQNSSNFMNVFQVTEGTSEGKVEQVIFQDEEKTSGSDVPNAGEGTDAPIVHAAASADSVDAGRDGSIIDAVPDNVQQVPLGEKDKVEAVSEKPEKETKAADSSQDLEKQLAEKDELIRQLRKEGEDLSKQHGQGREVIKRLKSKELESSRIIADLNRKLSDKELEVSDLRKTRDKLLELEKTQNSSIKSLNEFNQEIAKKLKSTQIECQKTNSQVQELEKELLIARQDLNNRSIDLSNQQDYQKLSVEFEEFKKATHDKELELKKELFDLRNTVSRQEKEHGWKEDQYQKEIANLVSKLQKSESRHEDLSSLGQEATKPLLRQIESLQAQYNSSLKDWEALEKSMAERVRDSEISRSQSVENARILQEENQKLLIQVKNLESAQDHLRNEKSRLEAEMDELKNVLQEERDKVAKEVAASRFIQEKHVIELEQIKAAMEIRHKNQLESEKRSWLEEKEADILRIRTLESTEKTRRSSVSQQSTESKTKENKNFEINKTNLIMMEKMQLSIKQLEAMVDSLQAQLALITKTRDDLADELYKISTENEDLKAAKRELDVIKSEKKSLEDKLLACAELIGEKEEIINELKADINEMRQVYQSQVEELCSKINSNKK